MPFNPYQRSFLWQMTINRVLESACRHECTALSWTRTSHTSQKGTGNFEENGEIVGVKSGG